MKRSFATALTFALATACTAPAYAMGTADAAARSPAGSSAAPRQASGPQLSAKNEVPKPPVLILALVGLGLAGLIVMHARARAPAAVAAPAGQRLSSSAF